MNFQSPLLLIFLILIPIFLWILPFTFRKKETAIINPVLQDLKNAQKKGVLIYVLLIKKIILSLSLVFLIIAIARPQTSHTKENIQQEGIDIIVAMDISLSMLAEDLKPNRLEAAKETFANFIQNVQGHRVGIVVFAGKTFTQSPLTFDYNVLENFFKNISITSINQRIPGLAGTAIGDAILASLNKFKNSNKNTDEADERNKVIILLTDGEANSGYDPLVAAEMAQKDNVKIYTIGIGSKDGVPLPMTDQFGKKTYARNQDGSPFLVTFDEETLKKIAQITKGAYFHVQDNNSLKQVLEAINQLEKKEIKLEQNTVYSEKFFPWALSAFISLFLFLFLSWKYPILK